MPNSIEIRQSQLKTEHSQVISEYVDIIKVKIKKRNRKLILFIFCFILPLLTIFNILYSYLFNYAWHSLSIYIFIILGGLNLLFLNPNKILNHWTGFLKVLPIDSIYSFKTDNKKLLFSTINSPAYYQNIVETHETESFFYYDNKE